MSRDVMTVHFDTDLEKAWNLLRLHKVKSLPVVDAFGNLIGIATVADFLRQMDDTSAAGLAVRLQGFLRRTPGLTSEKAEVVGQIMIGEIEHDAARCVEHYAHAAVPGWSPAAPDEPGGA